MAVYGLSVAKVAAACIVAMDGRAKVAGNAVENLCIFVTEQISRASGSA